jgi:hypothetical protein
VDGNVVLQQLGPEGIRQACDQLSCLSKYAAGLTPYGILAGRVIGVACESRVAEKAGDKNDTALDPLGNHHFGSGLQVSSKRG